MHLNMANRQINLSVVMRGGDEHEKLALDGFMNQFFTALLEQVRDYRDPTSAVPQPRDDDIVHLYMDTAGLGFTCSMDYAGRDRMTLGGMFHSIWSTCYYDY